MQGMDLEQSSGAESEVSVEQAVQALAKELKRRHLAALALIFLEMHRPLWGLCGAFSMFAEPFLKMFLSPGLVRSCGDLLREPETLEQLVQELARDSALGGSQ